MLQRAVVKESLRLSYGAPGRLPRIVPASGATFRGRDIPPGVRNTTFKNADCLLSTTDRLYRQSFPIAVMFTMPTNPSFETLQSLALSAGLVMALPRWTGIWSHSLADRVAVWGSSTCTRFSFLVLPLLVLAFPVFQRS